MIRLAAVGTCLAVVSFTLGVLGYEALRQISGHVFAGLYRMFMYHEEHPYQYIALVAAIFGVTGTLWHGCCQRLTGAWRWVSILICIALTVLLALVPGGMLWKLHDMQAGYFPQGRVFWKDLLWGAGSGLSMGWLVILLSFPYNLLGLVTGMLLLHKLPLVVSRALGTRASLNH